MDNFRLVSIIPNQYSPNYSYVFKFEKDFNHASKTQWMQKHWSDSFYWALLYLTFIFYGRIYMIQRSTPYQLKLPLIIWNLLLASFSIIGTLRTWPEMIHVLKNYGFTHSVCSNSYHKFVGVSGFWTWLFVLSKLPELVDTVFVILRRQKLIFLHWYHHLTVLIFSWYSYSDESSSARWYVYMNYVVHAIMYSYYALRAMGIKLPKPFAMLITISQIMQMIMGAFVVFYAYYLKSNSVECRVSYSALYAGMLIYISYFILFANFFVHSYLKKSTKKDTLNKKNK